MFYNQALADVRSTGAGIKCMYCIFTVDGYGSGKLCKTKNSYSFNCYWFAVSLDAFYSKLIALDVIRLF